MAMPNVMNRTYRGSVPMSPSRPRRRMDSARPSIPHSERLVIATRAENQSECDEKARNEWLQALDRIESLHPKAVVAGHGVLDPDSSPRHIEETRRYIRDFNACMATTSTPLQLYERMLSLHPNRVNPGSLWAAARAAKPSQGTIK